MKHLSWLVSIRPWTKLASRTNQTFRNWKQSLVDHEIFSNQPGSDGVMLPLSMLYICVLLIELNNVAQQTFRTVRPLYRRTITIFGSVLGIRPRNYVNIRVSLGAKPKSRKAIELDSALRLLVIRWFCLDFLWCYRKTLTYFIIRTKIRVRRPSRPLERVED